MSAVEWVALGLATWLVLIVAVVAVLHTALKGDQARPPARLHVVPDKEES